MSTTTTTRTTVTATTAVATRVPVAMCSYGCSNEYATATAGFANFARISAAKSAHKPAKWHATARRGDRLL